MPAELRKGIHNSVLAVFVLLISALILYLGLEVFFTLKGEYGLEQFIVGDSRWNADVKNGVHMAFSLSSNPGLGWELKPAELINKYDRFEEKAREKAPGVFRIIAIGDSIAQQGYFERFLEDRLNEDALGMRFEVWNCGVSGYNITNYYYYFRDIIPRFKPDFIILALCLNDFSGINLTIHDGKRFVEFFNPFIALDFPFSSRLFLHSRVYRFIVFGLERYILERASMEEILVGKFDKMLQLANERNLKIVALIWPHMKNQYDSAQQDEHIRIRHILESGGVPYADMHKSFTDRDAPGLKEYPGDYVHPSEKAFMMMSEDIYDFVSGYLEDNFNFSFHQKGRRAS
ncbi:MAG: SGNH/GDSL hydrolase family protein [Candidatus Omnitrophica bacterium]|nr:SGNH/GDSL hydrolase family protein [Candidatus Omnitrophota bacterium]